MKSEARMSRSTNGNWRSWPLPGRNMNCSFTCRASRMTNWGIWPPVLFEARRQRLLRFSMVCRREPGWRWCPKDRTYSPGFQTKLRQCSCKARAVDYHQCRDLRNAKVAKLADAPDLGSGGATHGGSSPPFRTNNLQPIKELP